MFFVMRKVYGLRKILVNGLIMGRLDFMGIFLEVHKNERNLQENFFCMLSLKASKLRCCIDY